MARTPADINEGQAEISGIETRTFSAHEGPVQVPDIDYITNGEIIRDGHDLILTTEDGQIVIEGYFLAEPSPQIISPRGAVLTPELVNSFAQSPGEYAQHSSLNDESPIGSVQEVSGNATVTRTDGSTQSIRIGTPVFHGDIVETDDEGAVNIVFIDETSFAVSDNARLAIDEYVFDPVSESGSTNFSVLRGVFVFTSGLIGRDDPDDVEINTPVGSIGIRGTMIAGDVDTGEITVIEGAIVLRSHDGMEMTLADQFATARFDTDTGGIVSMGQVQASDIGNKFSAISKVSPTFFNSVGRHGENEVDEGQEGQSEETAAEASGEEPAGDEAVTEDSASEDQVTDEASGDEPVAEEEAVTEDASSEEASTEESGAEETTAEEATATETTETVSSDTTTTETTTEAPPPSSGTATLDSSYSTDTTTDTGTTTPTTETTTETTTDTTTTDTAAPAASETSTDNSTTETTFSPPPFELNFARWGIDDTPVYGEQVAGVKVSYPDYYSEVTFTLNNGGSLFRLDQIDPTHAVIRYIGDESSILTIGDSYSFDVSAYSSAAGKSTSVSFAMTVGDIDYMLGPPAIDLAELGEPGVMKLNLGNTNLDDLAVSSTGDTDGDGVPDFIVFGHNGGANELYKWQFEGQDSSPQSSSTIMGDYSRMNTASLGDIDGDGKGDYAIGAPFYDDTNTDQGKASIHGSSAGTFEIYGSAASDYAGSGVTVLGDINNDGYSDFAVSVPGSGKVYTYLGSDTLANLEAVDYTITGTLGFGESVSAAGDQDGDGSGDLIIGSPQESAAHIYTADGTSIAKISGTGIGSGDDAFGNAVLGGFDINGDGTGDFVISGDNDAYIVYGRTADLDVSGGSIGAADGFKIEGDIASLVNGSLAGDFNADGYDDLIMVTSTWDSGSSTYINDLFVVYGGTDIGNTGHVKVSELVDDNVDSSQYVFQMIWDGNLMNGENIQVSAAGDLDGDGFDDILVASPDAGKAFIVYGRPAYGALDSTDPDMHAVGINHDPGMAVMPSSDHDSLVGNSGNDVLKDALAGSPGTYAQNISIRAGAGNDTLIVSSGRLDNMSGDNHRTLDGGEGRDTLELLGSGNIDFSGVNELGSIGHLDMNNGAGNTLILTYEEIFSLSEYDSGEGSYVLKITADSIDSVDITATTTNDFGYVATGTDYTSYVNDAGTHMLLVDNDVVSNFNIPT